jgi:hypothetical protein
METYYAVVKITGHESHGQDYDEYIYGLLNDGKGEKLEDVLIVQEDNEVMLNVMASGTSWEYVSKVITKEVNELDGKIQVLSVIQEDD